MLTETARAFASTRWHSRAHQSRENFERWQKKRLNTWLQKSVPNVAAFPDPVSRLDELPIIEKADLMGAFDQYNVPRITAQSAWQALSSGDQIGEMIVGASTGTTGNRGLFVISQQEQYRWLGTILAKTMADMVWQPQRVAIILPRNTSLYDSANRTRHLDLRFFDITQGVEAWINALSQFNPTVVVAPPRILRHLAETDVPLSPKRVFSAAETLDSIDETIITDRFGSPLRQIYMATEGLFAVSCKHGTLHLAEDSVFFELETVHGGLVSPIVSCFQRETQIMARYRMNDLLRLSATPCPCGSSLTAVSEVVGRTDDTFDFGATFVTPDVIRDAVVQAHPDIADFRVVQSGKSTVILTLSTSCTPDVAARAYDGLRSLFDARGLCVNVILQHADLALATDQKLRRVRKDWTG